MAAYNNVEHTIRLGDSFGSAWRKTRCRMPPLKRVVVRSGTRDVVFPGAVPHSFGQGAVAFDPIIGSAPSGQTMTVTPAVTADRRYVRLTVNGFFNTVNGFTSFNTPLGAVGGVGASGGGGLGGGGLGGGLGGLGGGLGGVGGLRSVGGFGAGGETFNAGMNGVIGPTGFDTAMGYAANGFAGQVGEMRAGALPYDEGGFDYGMDPGVATGSLGGNDVSAHTARRSRPAATAAAEMARSEASQPRSANAKTAASPRRPVPKAIARREKARSAHAARRKKASDEEPVIKPKTKRPPDSAD